MYNGLTTADKGALLDAKARGAEWVAREGNGDLWSYVGKPEKNHDIKFWSSNGKRYFNCDNATMKFVKWSDSEPVNIDLALAQIAEMEKNQVLSEIIDSIENPKPLTWNERINQMTVEEKATWLCDMDVCRISSISVEECNSYRHCTECMKNMLNSAAEGANQ